MTLPSGGGTVSFKYDPFGRRIQKSIPSAITNYLYDGLNALEELGGNGTLVVRYAATEKLDEQLSMQRSGILSVFNSDGLGSTTSLTDTTAQLSATYTYSTFGGLVSSTGSAANPFRYTGRDFDSDTNLYYYRARYYDASIGRFMSEDPLGFNSGNDFYTYVRNDSVEFNRSFRS